MQTRLASTRIDLSAFSLGMTGMPGPPYPVLSHVCLVQMTRAPKPLCSFELEKSICLHQIHPSFPGFVIFVLHVSIICMLGACRDQERAFGSPGTMLRTMGATSGLLATVLNSEHLSSSSSPRLRGSEFCPCSLFVF